MRELIDRQTVISDINKLIGTTAPKAAKHIEAVIMAAPTVTRMQEESYQRLIGKKVTK